MENYLHAQDHVNPYLSDPTEAGSKLADVWCQQKPEGIDLWNCDWVYHEFLEAFLERCLHHKCLEEACKIQWSFPCETGADLTNGPYFSDEFAKWIKEFKENIANDPTQTNRD